VGIATPEGPRIVLAAYDLALELYPAVRGFPKSQQYLLGRRLEEAALDVLCGLIAANKTRRKQARLRAVDAELEKLRLLVRLSCDLRFLGPKRYARLAERIDEVGRMLGGWLKWAGGTGAAQEAFHADPWERSDRQDPSGPADSRPGGAP
jgi:hypothetical protein